MAFRTFADFLIKSATVPQPLVGSWITAGLTVPVKQQVTITLGTATASGNDSSNIFQPGDNVYLIDPDGTHTEQCLIVANSSGVSQIANTITLAVRPETQAATTLTHKSGAFGTGSFIALANSFNNMFIQMNAGNAGLVYLGSQWNFKNPAGTPAGFRLITTLQNVAAGTQPYFYSATESFFGNPFVSHELWAMGDTVGDKYRVTFNQV